jgi:hypothetical protein
VGEDGDRAALDREPLKHRDELPGLTPIVLVARIYVGERVDDDELRVVPPHLARDGGVEPRGVDRAVALKLAQHGVLPDEVGDPDCLEVGEGDAEMLSDSIQPAMKLAGIVLAG